MDCTITVDTSPIEDVLFKFKEFTSFEGIPEHLIDFFFDNLSRIISIDFCATLTTSGSIELVGRAKFRVSFESCVTALRAGKRNFIRHISSLNES